MKKIFITTIIVLSTILTFAQTSEHLLFKGVPIDGTRNAFVVQMGKKGFVQLATQGETTVLQGDFAGYKDCMIAVVTLKQKDLVSNISVFFSSAETWSPLSENYFQLKEMLTQKYGVPVEVLEKFDTYSEPDDDNSRMHEVKMDRCKYYTIFETDKGSIQLSIEHTSELGCFVLLQYFDKINSEIIKNNGLMICKILMNIVGSIVENNDSI